MRISARVSSDFNVEVNIYDPSKNTAEMSILYYGIIRAMKEHGNDAFMFAMDKFISEEIDEMTGDEEDD